MRFEAHFPELVFLYFCTKWSKEYLHEMCITVLDRVLSTNYVALAIDPFSGSCYWSLLGVVSDVISDATAEEEEAIGWMFPSSGSFARFARSPPWEWKHPSNGLLLLGGSIADDVTGHQEEINSEGPWRDQCCKSYVSLYLWQEVCFVFYLHLCDLVVFFAFTRFCCLGWIRTDLALLIAIFIFAILSTSWFFCIFAAKMGIEYLCICLIWVCA